MIKVNSQLAACSLSYAKIRVNSLTTKFFGQKKRLEQEASNLESDLEKL